LVITQIFIFYSLKEIILTFIQKQKTNQKYDSKRKIQIHFFAFTLTKYIFASF